MSRHLYLLRSLLLLCLLTSLASAQEPKPAPNLKPVGIVSSIYGDVQIKRHDSKEFSDKAFRLSLLYPRDFLQTKANSKVVVTYFHDRSKWVLESEAMARVEHDKLTTDELFADRIRAKTSTPTAQSFGIPHSLFTPISEASGLEASTGDISKEEVYLTAYVDTAVYPPAFHWAPNSLSDYKLLLFGMSGEFLHSFHTDKEDFSYPAGHTAPFRMTKGQIYFWEVVDVDNNILVGKYPFSPITKPHIKEIDRYQKLLTPTDETTQVDLLLVLVQHRALDKYLHVLQEMHKQDPANPIVRNALAQAYLQRGAPAHALQALGR